MKKTNIRINNYYIIEEGDKYYLSNIDDPNEWKKKINNLKDQVDKEITKKLYNLMNYYDIYSSVNFFINIENNEMKEIQIGG